MVIDNNHTDRIIVKDTGRVGTMVAYPQKSNENIISKPTFILDAVEHLGGISCEEPGIGRQGQRFAASNQITFDVYEEMIW